MGKKRQIGIFGGTFDPIHFGHLNMALSILEARKLDEVWFVPAQLNPHKKQGPAASGLHRLAMLKLAFEEMPSFKAVDTELLREGPSYTIETLRMLIEKYGSGSCEFSLIIGEDSMPGFSRWHLAKEIIDLVPIYVGIRRGWQNDGRLCEDAAVDAALQNGVTPTPIMEISATEIRSRIRNKKHIRYLTPSKVVDYIYTNHLYSEDLIEKN